MKTKKKILHRKLKDKKEAERLAAKEREKTNNTIEVFEYDECDIFRATFKGPFFDVIEHL